MIAGRLGDNRPSAQPHASLQSLRIDAPPDPAIGPT